MSLANQNSRPAVLVFCRDYLVPDFAEMIAPHREQYDFTIVTDGTCQGVVETKRRFYFRLNTAKMLAGWTDDDEANAIARCRLLRNLPREKALRMLRSMSSVLNDEMERVNPRVVFAQMVDEYVTYILAELARRRGIKYIGICYSYFPNRIQVTEYWNGYPHDCRLISDDEALQTLETISQRTFRQDYLQKNTYTFRRHLVAVARYRVKSLVFPIIALLRRDAFNIHFACLPFVVERRRLSDFPNSRDFHIAWQEMIRKAVVDNGKPVVYMPLGYFPESTIDYWIGDKRILDYENVVLEVCHRLSEHFNILIKEHLHMLGARSRKFFQKLMEVKGVVSVPPTEFSHDASTLADVIVIGGGSVGVESYVRGKPVATFCDTSYWYQPSGAAFLDLSDLPSWPRIIQRLIRTYKTPADNEKMDFMRACLKSTIRVARHGVVWPIPQDEDVSFLLAASTSATLMENGCE